jgi:phosphatidylglycerophosphate synthase
MPEPDNLTFSVDYYIYKYLINPISKNICFIHPNIVTISAFLLTIPIYYNLINNGTYYEFALLGFLRILLDCFDGSIARECNLKSKLGAILDILFDGLHVILLFSFIIYNLHKQIKKDYFVRYIIIIFYLIICYFTNQIVEELIGIRTGDNMFKYTFDKYIHDNLLIIIPLFYLVLKYIFSKYQF